MASASTLLLFCGAGSGQRRQCRGRSRAGTILAEVSCLSKHAQRISYSLNFQQMALQGLDAGNNGKQPAPM